MIETVQFTVVFRFAIVFTLAVGILACSLTQKRIDPNFQNETESGFGFQFPMSGEWYLGDSAKGQYSAGKKPKPDGSTTVAIVRHGPIWTPGGKPMTSSELLDRFQKDIVTESQAGPVSKVESKFSQRKHGGADCLFFNQVGEDNGSHGAMNISNDGMICLHPTRKYQFIWMAISQRVPVGKAGENLAEDEKRFIGSLRFL